MRISLNTRITLCFVLIISILGIVVTLAGVHFIGSGIISQAQSKVKLDLNTAREIYNNRLESIRTILEFTAIRPSIKKALIERDRAALGYSLNEVRHEGELDLLAVTDSGGNVVLRSQNPAVYGDDQMGDPMISRAIREMVPLAATAIIPLAELEKDGREYVERADIRIISTPKAEPESETILRSGMALKSAVPVFDDNEKLIGVIYGGILLNRNFEIVDKIKDIVYHDEKYEGKEIGTATIFQGDVRISTNVRTEAGDRAIGTRVSKEVSQQVLKNGRSWIDEAFVVNDWYITAYEPIYDLQKKVIGILYVGMLKKPFVAKQIGVVNIFLIIAVIGVVAVIIVANMLARRITRPLREIQKMAQQIAAGDYSKDIVIKSRDEIGELADSFNRMTGELKRHQDELKRWGETLEDKIEKRTAEISEMQKQLMHAEKMASVGKLAAGVAHEINNPLTGILTNSSLILDEIDKDNSMYEDVKTIVDETIRCREIVKGLLEFSRQTEPRRSPTDINDLVKAVMALVQKQVIFQNIKTGMDLADPPPKIMIDKDQISQVLMNIILNAAEAMPGGGTLGIHSWPDSENKLLIIEIADTGCGIGREEIDRIFDPFYSSKEKGTGLGLSISYGIVERHGGTIEVKSREGAGSTFVIRLPLFLSEEK